MSSATAVLAQSSSTSALPPVAVAMSAAKAALLSARRPQAELYSGDGVVGQRRIGSTDERRVTAIYRSIGTLRAGLLSSASLGGQLVGGQLSLLGDGCASAARARRGS